MTNRLTASCWPLVERHSQHFLKGPTDLVFRQSHRLRQSVLLENAHSFVRIMGLLLGYNLESQESAAQHSLDAYTNDIRVVGARRPVIGVDRLVVETQ